MMKMKISRSKARKLRDRRTAVRKAFRDTEALKTQAPFISSCVGWTDLSHEQVPTLQYLVQKLDGIELLLNQVCASWQSQSCVSVNNSPGIGTGTFLSSLRSDAAPFSPGGGDDLKGIMNPATMEQRCAIRSDNEVIEDTGAQTINHNDVQKNVHHGQNMVQSGSGHQDEPRQEKDNDDDKEDEMKVWEMYDFDGADFEEPAQSCLAGSAEIEDVSQFVWTAPSTGMPKVPKTGDSAQWISLVTSIEQGNVKQVELYDAASRVAYRGVGCYVTCVIPEGGRSVLVQAYQQKKVKLTSHSNKMCFSPASGLKRMS